jgi:hypothetical protein
VTHPDGRIASVWPLRLSQATAIRLVMTSGAVPYQNVMTLAKILRALPVFGV